MNVTVPNKESAMELAKQLLEVNELYEDEKLTKEAGHPVLNYWNSSRLVDDFGDHLVVFRDGETLNIFIDPLRDLRFDDIKDALDMLDDIIYGLDDKMSHILKENTHIGEARDLLYGAWAEIRDILVKKFPDRADKLIKTFHLDEV